MNQAMRGPRTESGPRPAPNGGRIEGGMNRSLAPPPPDGPDAGLAGAVGALTEVTGGAAALLVIPLVVATCREVFARYVLSAPTIWAFELGYAQMGVHFILGGALMLKRQSHVRIDLIYARLTPRRRALIDLTSTASSGCRRSSF